MQTCLRTPENATRRLQTLGSGLRSLALAPPSPATPCGEARLLQEFPLPETPVSSVCLFGPGLGRAACACASDRQEAERAAGSSLTSFYTSLPEQVAQSGRRFRHACGCLISQPAAAASAQSSAYSTVHTTKFTHPPTTSLRGRTTQINVLFYRAGGGRGLRAGLLPWLAPALKAS